MLVTRPASTTPDTGQLEASISNNERTTDVCGQPHGGPGPGLRSPGAARGQVQAALPGLPLTADGEATTHQDFVIFKLA